MRLYCSAHMSARRRNHARLVSILLILALPAAAGSDAGAELRAVYAERATYLLPNAGWEESACFAVGDGGTDCSGAWLPLPRALATGRELASLRAENATLRAAPATPVALVIAFGVGVVLGGAAVGYVAWKLR